MPNLENMFLMLETLVNMWANQETLFPQENVFEFVWKHFCSLGCNFCFRNNVSGGGQTEKY